MSLLLEAQEKLRASEDAQRDAAETQAAVLNALPAHVALIDPQGIILTVNESWLRLPAGHALLGATCGIGQNYLDACDAATGDCSEEAIVAAVGIRRVLTGDAKDFVLEYSCHSSTERRWFQLTVTPLREDRRAGAVVMHVNISERRLAEETVRRSQKRLRDLIDGLGPSIFVGLMTPDGVLIEVNRPALTAAALQPEDFLGKRFEDTYSWSHSVAAQRQTREAIERAARGTPSHYDVQVRVAADQLIDVDFSLQPVRDETGGIAFLVASASVITERKQMENALRESDDKFRLLADNITDAFWIRSPDMAEVRYISPAFERIWGRSAASAAENPHLWVSLIVPEDRERVARSFAALRREAAGIDLEYRILRPDGEIRWIRARGFQVRNAAGLLTSLTGIVTDITERKRIEAEGRLIEETLQRQNTELRVLFDLVPAMIWFKDTNNGILRVNERVAELAGLSVAEIEGRPTHEIYPTEAARFLADDQEVIASGVAKLGYVESMRNSDGSEMWVQTDKVPYRDKDGHVIGIVVMAQDITARRNSEETLRTSIEATLHSNRALQAEIAERTRAEDAADAANRSKSEFLANMSHEIRTPLNGVVGMTDLVLDTDLTAEQREYLDMVKASGESLLALIDDILDFSKIEAGMLTIDAIPFNLSDCLTTTLKLLATRAHLKGLELACDIAPDVPTALVGDPSRLRQIITNLVGNAIKFTEHGEVVVTVAVQALTDATAILRISVSDTGIGIPLDQQDAIFKPFIQADGSTTRQYGGTGLGLAISTNLVTLLGGRIWLESEFGKGSTFHFTVTFGRRPAEVPETTAKDAQMAHLRDMPVLVVDDNVVNRRILETMLRRWHMKPLLVRTGRAGMIAMVERKAAGAPFPLVLVDARMPDMDGFSVAEEIRKDPALVGATVLMLTSAGRRGDVARCMSLGIAAYLTKPISQAELLEAILAVLDVPLAGDSPPQVITRHSLREGRRRFNILLAEDNKINQLVAARVLGKRGHTVVVAATGRAALAALDAAGGADFDLILMDVQMPDMDGFETTAAIRAREKAGGAHLPIIAMTANAMKGDEERCLAAGMDGYVSKPLDVEQLFAVIDTVLGL